MRRFVAIAAAVAAVASAPVFATPINGLYNTGVMNGEGKVDTNYAFAAVAGTFKGVTYGAGQATGTSYNGGTYGVAQSNDTNPAWMVTAPKSYWLAPTADTDQTYDPTTTGSYTWTANFNLAANTPIKMADLTAQWASDNEGYVTLNGHTLANSTINYGYPAFQKFYKFSASTSDFVAGTNSLVFHVFNVAPNSGDNPTGINVQFLKSDIVAAPVPASALLFVSAMAGLVVFGRKRRQSGSLNSMAA